MADLFFECPEEPALYIYLNVIHPIGESLKRYYHIYSSDYSP